MKCEWSKCSDKAEYLIAWNNGPRPVAIHPFTDRNILCGKHFRKVMKDFPHTKRHFEVCELHDLTEKVQFT
jgi:hypothetical protein